MKKSSYGNLKYSIRILNNGDDTYSVEVPKLPDVILRAATKMNASLISLRPSSCTLKG